MYNTFTLHQLISESPTDYGSMLDLLYTSDQHVLHGVLESWYSDHKPVWAAIPALEYGKYFTVYIYHYLLELSE